MKSGSNKKQYGFSSIEIMVSTVIAMIVLAGVTNTFIGQTRYYNAQEHVNEMQQNARAAIDLMVREIKLAGYDPAGTAITASNGIPYSSSQLEVLADLNGDGSATASDEDVIYTYDGDNLRIRRTTAGVTTTVAENISAFTFAYLDASGNPTTTTGNIRQIQIGITARTSKPDPNYTVNNGYMTYQLTALITPQNLCYKAGSCP